MWKAILNPFVSMHSLPLMPWRMFWGTVWSDVCLRILLWQNTTEIKILFPLPGHMVFYFTSELFNVPHNCEIAYWRQCTWIDITLLPSKSTSTNTLKASNTSITLLVLHRLWASLTTYHQVTQKLACFVFPIKKIIRKNLNVSKFYMICS